MRTEHCGAEPLSAEIYLNAKELGFRAHALLSDDTDCTGTYEYNVTTVTDDRN